MHKHDEHGSALAWSWHHAGLVVANLDRAIEFYTSALGYKVEFLVREMDDQFQRTVGVDGVVCDLAQLTAPYSGTLLELLEVRNVPSGLDPRLPVHVGVGHGAYQVRDLEASVDLLTAAGGNAMGEIVSFEEGRAIYCWSPAGTVVELEEAW
ncbi:catechol 2,3-dioxygenase-like lactoylglutathione lyase family enzyme [Microbacteriaceae bacterium SG_E_30_P1]|uniref:Catechol 2,3-dioxygenase-like lactoylglutathione lyase family enzyme n=1 Tax=Antiquaquibacter oligotrophicus TaxID=2880260 RepID=A0ABT6KM31_9MICO|nr:VOC family protein [Antiquaquibacter oligotrophicus]MDH6181072.1 catechol 2,3-dioxygenase-like lactoylglutathione lyase family enzyme [Antiquaquibacter oligotrophicus]UDF13230.1 VOC family protein [Antiquaquibacter oligotrophicus]